MNVTTNLTITHVGAAELPYYIASHNDHAPLHPNIGNTAIVVKPIIIQ